MSPHPRYGGPRENVRVDDIRRAWSELLDYASGYRYHIVAALVMAFIGTVFTLIGPDGIGEMTDLVSAGVASGTVDLGRVASIGTFLVAIYAAGAVLTFLQGYIMATVSQRTAQDLRRDLSRKMDRLPLGYFDRSSVGDVLSRVTNDVDTIGQSMNMSLGTLVTAATLLIGSAVMMLVTDVTMAVTAILASLFGFILMAVIMSRSQRHFDAQQRNLGAMNGHVEEIYTNHDIVRVYNGEERAMAVFDDINDRLFRSALSSQFLSGLMAPLMMFIGNIGYVAVCIVGAVLVLEGQISFGVIVSFMIYVRLFTQPMSQMAQAFAGMQSVAAASGRVFEFLNEEEMDVETTGVRLEDVRGEVEFRDVHFGYTPDREIIHGFSVRVEPGQKVAIVGPTGAGKTTLVNLLMRFYEVDSGDILVDGVSLRDMRREDVHDLFCMVLQDTWLFEGTIRENIVYCTEGVTDEDLIEASDAVGLHHFVTTLPNGYDTVLDDRTTISAGQRQQITIARAMVQDAPLLILDEATSSVDTRTERMIQRAMDELTEGRTSFVIAHRLSTIRDADLILVMRDGNVVEMGTHDGLMAAGGFYRDLYNTQFEGMGDE